MSYIMYFDGASRGNPGQSACGVALYLDEKLIAELYHYLGPDCSSNVAEYKALTLGLQMIIKQEFPIENLTCKGDSHIVIQQMKGEWVVRNKKLRELYVEATLMAEKFENIVFQHVQREANHRADFLANKGILMKKAFTRTYSQDPDF